MLVPEAADQPADIAALRRRIAALEGRPSAFAAETAEAVWRLGVPVVDAALPPGGLESGAVHDVVGANHGDLPAALGFLLALAIRRMKQVPGSVLCCVSPAVAREWGALYAPGLQRFGMMPGRFVLAQGRNDAEALWAMEEGVKAGPLALVLGLVGEAEFIASRRLALAAAQSTTPVLLLAARASGHSAAASRWRVATAPAAAHALDPAAAGAPRWLVDLVRCRGGHIGTWSLDWQHETHSFHLSAALADRPPPLAGPAKTDAGLWRRAG